MDPLTLSLSILNNSLVIAGKVWDATPDDQKKIAASDYAKFNHNVVAFLTSIQDKINAAVK